MHQYLTIPVTSLINSSINFPTPAVVYNLPKPIPSTIFDEFLPDFILFYFFIQVLHIFTENLQSPGTRHYIF